MPFPLHQLRRAWAIVSLAILSEQLRLRRDVPREEVERTQAEAHRALFESAIAAGHHVQTVRSEGGFLRCAVIRFQGALVRAHTLKPVQEKRIRNHAVTCRECLAALDIERVAQVAIPRQ